MPARLALCCPRIRRLAFALSLFAAATSKAGDVEPVVVDTAAVPVVGHACEGCEAVFHRLPSSLGAVLRLAPQDEAGERLLLDGRVLDRRGAPVEGVVLYVYQTDASGVYPAADATVADGEARRHGRLRGWVRSAADGGYRIETVRPGGYPGTDIPQHIHVHVLEPGCATYFIDDVLFDDDPRLTPTARRRLASGVGGDGIVRAIGGADGWVARRDVVLGRGIPDYPACGRG